MAAGLTAEPAPVVTGARRRALRDGDRQIDTAPLLHSLIESDPAVRALFDGPQAARVLGCLVQRSIGYGLRWRARVEGSGAVPPARGADMAGWSPAAVAVMEAALARAALRGAERAAGVDLLAGIAADRGCRAVEVLTRAGIDTEALAGRIGNPSQQV
ncbi:Clp protease N-terminal domain-containing protein [Streptomyces sp. SP18CS02]|nr:Clp protease N-terminal domain-containing protein [Streptomyces sp. SP18CS02]MEE1755511.1 Clp protease N-terminal domain-containing protein [Streptomyces sp. SP18CS02]